MSQKACTILRDSIPVYPSGYETIDSPLIDIYDHQDIKCANPQIIFNEEDLKDATIIARTIKDSACGFEKKLEKGSIIHFGTWLGFDTEGHKPVYEALLARSGAKLRQAIAGHENISVRERFTGEGSALLFIANYYNEDFEGNVVYTHPQTGEPVAIPYSGEKMLWPALYAVLTPVGLKLADGLSILHSTSDILDISVQNDRIELTLFGDRDLMGELVLEGENADKIKAVSIDGKVLKMVKANDRVVLNYDHSYRKELIAVIQV
jgi:hypothetical protein